jgi:hypothetical protein
MDGTRIVLVKGVNGVAALWLPLLDRLNKGAVAMTARLVPENHKWNDDNV